MKRKRFTLVVPVVAVIGLSFSARPSFAHMPGCYIVWADAPEMPGPGNAFGKYENDHEKKSKREHEPRRGRDERFHYSTAEVLDIDFYVLLPASSDRSLELQILTPQGHLYQTLSLNAPRPAIVEVGVESQSHTKGKSSTKKPKSRGRYKPRFVWASAKLPVAGTTIVNNSLYGRWTAVPFLKGDSTPCANGRGFTLSP